MDNFLFARESYSCVWGSIHLMRSIYRIETMFSFFGQILYLLGHVRAIREKFLSRDEFI
jgi:hypothetical protein